MELSSFVRIFDGDQLCGTGYRLSRDRVLTAFHVVDGAADVRVELERGDGSVATAEATVLWAKVEVEDVPVRFRWIPPGRFRMGSPDDEAGRWKDEGPRHEVTLTRGFWLAETSCTQALWEAVVGENPSRFQSSDRPVDQMSWDDCQGFLEKVNGRVPGLEARLPTEAEWEYACRAGTETSTYAPDLDKIAWWLWGFAELPRPTLPTLKPRISPRRILGGLGGSAPDPTDVRSSRLAGRRKPRGRRRAGRDGRSRLERSPALHPFGGAT